MKQFVNIVNKYYDVDIMTPRRFVKVKTARFVYCYIMSEVGFTQWDIAKELNLNRASTIHNAIKKTKEDMLYNKTLIKDVEYLTEKALFIYKDKEYSKDNVSSLSIDLFSVYESAKNNGNFTDFIMDIGAKINNIPSVIYVKC
ncbi:MAG: hypothetical protein HQ471_00370 [Flavobacteriales bacterium]|nr:hypothetical protein [Flavobacteriales bacterium]